MAAKLFCITNTSNGTNNLIWANKPAEAMAVVLGDEFNASVATDEQLYAMGRTGIELHPSGVDEGTKGSRFVLVTRKTDPAPVLVRATNPSDGIARLAGASLKVVVADQATIVKCMAAGIQPSFAPGVTPPAATPPATNSSGTAGGATNMDTGGSQRSTTSETGPACEDINSEAA